MLYVSTAVSVSCLLGVRAQAARRSLPSLLQDGRVRWVIAGVRVAHAEQAVPQLVVDWAAALGTIHWSGPTCMSPVAVNSRRREAGVTPFSRAGQFQSLRSM